MLLSLVKGSLIMPEPGAHGSCPGCGAETIAKCGDLVIWHWAHAAGAECDPWSEGESQWHLSWKRSALEAGCHVEVPFRDGSEWHRADVVRPDGVIVELQHSSLAIGEALDREQFYRRHGGLIWLWDARETWWQRVEFEPERGLWRWDDPAETVASLGSVQYWDSGDHALVEVRVERNYRTVAYLRMETGLSPDTVFEASITLPAAEQWRLAPMQCARCGALPVGTFRDGSPRYACHAASPELHQPITAAEVAARLLGEAA